MIVDLLNDSTKFASVINPKRPEASRLMFKSVVLLSLLSILLLIRGRDKGLRSPRHRMLLAGRIINNSTLNYEKRVEHYDEEHNATSAYVTNDHIASMNDTKQTRSTGACSSDQRRVVIAIETDGYGWETSWLLKGKSGVVKRSPSYESSNTYEHKICVDVGMYTFIIKDIFNDFIGSYKVSVEDRVAVTGSGFISTQTYLIDIGQTESVMSERDRLYLDAHNTRRIDWHARYNKEYVPLNWSQGLKELSMAYAVKLLDTCTTDTPRHDPNNPYGENLARNRGSGSWGQLYSPDKILNRFVEREEGLPWARNGHLTNALWRATKYVGCAEAEKSYPVSNARGVSTMHTCRAQVCRYAKPGNCSMGRFKDEDGKTDWLTAMLQDDSPCTPECPPEGCFN